MSFEDFVEKETEKEIKRISLIIFIILIITMTVVILIAQNNETNSIFSISESEYKNVYFFQDNSWFIIDRENEEYIFQPIELGDWDIELNSEKDLKNIMATYFINKYDIEEEKAIKEINNILGGIE